MRPQALPLRPPLGFLLDGLAEFGDLRRELIEPFEQIVPSSRPPPIQRERFQLRSSLLSPQPRPPLYAFVPSDRVQLILHPRPHLHQTSATPHPLPQIASLRTRHPHT